MAHQQRIVWYEGMTLDPHHFQQWDRYHRGMLNSRFRSTQPFDWGLTRLEISREGLESGLVGIKSCKGIMQDGLAFDIPESDAAPPARSIGDHFPPKEEKLGIYLGVPLERSQGGNCPLDQTAATNRITRYSPLDITLPDDNAGFNERQVTVSQPNFFLLFGDEHLEEYSALHIADIVRAADGSNVLSPRFIPPCLSIAASDNLMNAVRRVFELLVAKTKTLAERRRQQPSGQIEFTTADVTLLGILQTINRYVPLVSHHYSVTRCHPETMYTLLASIAGELTTFSPDLEIRLSEFPAYDHNNLAESFTFLDQRITQLLEAVVSTNFIQIRLDRKSENRYIGAIPDETLLRTAQFYLTVSGDLPERKVIDELPHKIKVGGPDDIDRLVGAALQGLAVTHAARAPVGLPSRPGLFYFRLEKSGPLWDAIRKSMAVAVFVPAEFKVLRLELIAVKES